MSKEGTTSGQSCGDDVESLVSKDAEALPPRDQQGGGEAGDQRDPEVGQSQQSPVDEESMSIQMPDPNWRFNSFLVDLADEIDGSELDKLKGMFLGIIGRGVMEKLTSAIDLFDHLRRRNLLNRDNLVCLQTILMKLKRPELIQMAVDYCKTVGDLVYFYPDTSGQVNGYRKAKFHVEGKDFKNCTPKFVRELKATLSNWLFVPVEHVLIAGIDPSSSMLITVTLPDMYADILEKLLKQEDALQPLADLEIDTVQIGDNVFNIRGIDEAEIVETEEQIKLVSVYQQLQDKSRALDNMDQEVIKLVDEQKQLKKQMADLQMESVTLRNMFYNSENGTITRPASLSSQAALMQFKESLREVKTLNYDRTVIRKLLDANATVMVNRSRESLDIQLQQMKLQVQELQSQLMPLQLELLFCRANEAGNLEKILKDSLLKLLEAISVPEQKVEQTLTVYGDQILKKISRTLRYREKQKLEKKYEWDPEDYLTQCKDEDPSLFLSCLFYKETEQRQGFVDFEKFVLECLKEVNRPDLQRKFHEMLTKPQRQPRPRPRAPPGQGLQAEASPMQEEQLADIGKEVHSIMEKIERIENAITSAMNYRSAFDQPFSSKPFPTGTNGIHFQPSNLKQAI